MYNFQKVHDFHLIYYSVCLTYIRTYRIVSGPSSIQLTGLCARYYICMAQCHCKIEQETINKTYEFQNIFEKDINFRFV